MPFCPFLLYTPLLAPWKMILAGHGHEYVFDELHGRLPIIRRQFLQVTSLLTVVQTILYPHSTKGFSGSPQMDRGISLPRW